MTPRHGNSYNEHCKYCRAIDLVVFVLLLGGSLLVIAKILTSNTISEEDKVAIPLSIAIALTIMWFTRGWINKILPQTHGYLFDLTQDNKWYKPRKAA